MKCFICGKEYDPKDIQDFVIDNGVEPTTINKIKYQGVDFPLCNTCFRLTVFNVCLKERYNIIK